MFVSQMLPFIRLTVVHSLDDEQDFNQSHIRHIFCIVYNSLFYKFFSRQFRGGGSWSRQCYPKLWWRWKGDVTPL